MVSSSTTASQSEYEKAVAEVLDEFGPDPADPLVEAVHRGERDKVAKYAMLLKGSETLRPKNEAILMSRPDLLKVLLDADQLIEEGMIINACQRKDKDSLQMLFDAGWDINRRLHFYPSLLCLGLDDVEFIKWLIYKGADINAIDALGQSVLCYSVIHSSMEVVQYLLQQDPNIRHSDLLHCAVLRKNQVEGAELIQQLVQRGAAVDSYRYNNDIGRWFKINAKLPTPLHTACEVYNKPAAAALIQCGANPSCYMLKAGTPIPPRPMDLALLSDDKELTRLMERYSIAQQPIP